MPSVVEHLLDTAVMEAVREVVIQPQVILEPLRQLQHADVRERRQRVHAARSRQTILARLKAEEERVLEAYRTSIITPGQLGQQLEAIKTKRAGLENQNGEISEQPALPIVDADRAISEYCAQAANNLASYTHEQWRNFLRVIITNITFRGKQINIQGRILVEGAGAQLRLETPVMRASDGLRPK
jgi:hypothetical protein